MKTNDILFIIMLIVAAMVFYVAFYLIPKAEREN